MRRLVGAAALSLSLVGLACSSSGSSSKPFCDGLTGDQAEQCFTDVYFGGAAAETLPPCPTFAPTKDKVGGRREIDFFRNGAITDGDVTIEGKYLQRFYNAYDLTFFTNGPADVVGFAYAVGGTQEQIDAAAKEAGIAPGETPTTEQKAKLNELVADVLFADLRTFVKAQAAPPKNVVEIVVLEHIASPAVQAQLGLGVLAGLGLSPVLFKNIAASDPSKNLFQLLALPDDFTPVLFVGHTDITNLAKNPDGIVAHEMGHALGLQHTSEAGNVMTQGQADSACLPGLTSDQVAQLKASTGDAIAIEGWQRLLDLHERAVATAIARNVARR